jgi:hypothetical protein
VSASPCTESAGQQQTVPESDTGFPVQPPPHSHPVHMSGSSVERPICAGELQNAGQPLLLAAAELGTARPPQMALQHHLQLHHMTMTHGKLLEMYCESSVC